MSCVFYAYVDGIFIRLFCDLWLHVLSSYNGCSLA